MIQQVSEVSESEASSLTLQGLVSASLGSSDSAPRSNRKILLSSRLSGTRASDHLNLVRGLAAVAVVAFHLRGTFYIDRVPGTGAVLWLFYFLTSLGHQAVMVFFVLSGFLIGASVLRGIRERQWDWGGYLINRFSRLYVVLIPALVLGEFWDRFGIGLIGTRGIYGGLVPNASILTSVQPALGWPVFVGNLFFLQTIVVPSLGSNGPLWSLSNEFWYYLMFPLGLFVLSGRSGARRWLYLVGLSAIVTLVGYTITRLIVVWLLGAGLNLLPRFEHLRARMLSSTALVLFFLALVLSSLQPGLLRRALPNDLWVGLASSILIYALLQDVRPSANGLYARIAKQLAQFSYTLYLVHLPLLVFLKATLLPRDRWIANAQSILIGAAVLASLLGYAWMISKLTEARTDLVRRHMISVLFAEPRVQIS